MPSHTPAEKAKLRRLASGLSGFRSKHNTGHKKKKKKKEMKRGQTRTK